MKKTLGLLLLILIASCGSSGGNNNTNGVFNGSNLTPGSAGVYFPAAVQVCPGGAVTIAAGSVLTMQQLYQYFGSNYLVFGSATAIGQGVVAQQAVSTSGIVTQLVPTGTQYSGTDLMSISAGNGD